MELGILKFNVAAYILTSLPVARCCDLKGLKVNSRTPKLKTTH